MLAITYSTGQSVGVRRHVATPCFITNRKAVNGRDKR